MLCYIYLKKTKRFIEIRNPIKFKEAIDIIIEL